MPREPRAHYLLAKALLEQKRVEEALKEASTALSIEERNPKYMVQKASILDRLKRHDEAANLMKRDPFDAGRGRVLCPARLDLAQA